MQLLMGRVSEARSKHVKGERYILSVRNLYIYMKSILKQI